MSGQLALADHDVRIIRGEVREDADAAWQVVDADGTELARCSLWWRRPTLVAGRRAGLIGRYASVDARAGERLLRHACVELAACGCGRALGPMDGSTWGAYRFVTERGSEPRFFMEPDNDDDWPLQFARCGFTAIGRYRSALQTDANVEDARIGRVAARMTTAGIRIRCIDDAHLDEELARLHPLVMAGFAEQPFFTPLSVDTFVALHRDLRPMLRPELVLIAAQCGEPVALLFAVPDHAQQLRGVPVDTVIVKTIVARPGRQHAGVAHVLLARATACAREAGFRRQIHALMRESSAASHWSAHSATTMRRYALFARLLDR